MTESNTQLSALSGYRVLEVGDEVGHYCGKLLADLGAEVIKVEPPEGVASRRRGPFSGGESHSEKSLRFLYFNANKKSVTLDLEQEAGKKSFRTLVQSADVVIEALPQGSLSTLGVGYTTFSKGHPGLVWASISGFGTSGPHAAYKAPDIVSYAMGGHMSYSGQAPKAPLAPPGEATTHFVGTHAAHAVLTALYHRQRAGRGQHLEVAAQEVLAYEGNPFTGYSAVREILERPEEGSETGQTRFAAKDGYVQIGVGVLGRHWRDFVAWLGNPAALQGPEWDDRRFRTAHPGPIIEAVEACTGERLKQQVYEDGQAHAFLVAPFNSPAEYLVDPQVTARGFVVEAEHPVLGRYRTIASPYRLSETPCIVGKTAPLLGEHNSLLLGQPSRPAGRAAPATGSTSSALPGQGALRGVRVLDFTWEVFGPYLTRFLAEQGAQVIKIESSTHFQVRGTRPGGDPRVARQQQANFANMNRNKLDITLNMQTQEARRLARELAKISDVVLDNFTPRVLPNWGLDFDTLRGLNPGIIVASLSSLGTTGPQWHYRGNAPVGGALVGLSYLWNYEGAAAPFSMRAWPIDPNGGVHGATAVMAALLHRERTGQGQLIEVAQTEAVASMFGPIYLDVLANGARPQPQGNARSDAAPYGCFRCCGEDKWCAVAVTSDEEWRSFCDVLGKPAWSQDSRYATAAGRVEHRGELERHVEEWTSQRTPYQVMGLLQEAGVPAGAVQNGEDLYRDPHLRTRDYFVSVEHPGLGPLEHAGPAVRYSETPVQLAPYALMGQHNREVFCGLLGLSETEFERLEREGILA